MQMARYHFDPPLTQIGATELSAVGPFIVPLITRQCKKCSDDYEGFFRSGSIICNLDTYTKETQVLGFAKYGKSTAAISPAFDITPDGVGLSITYVEKVSDAGSDSFRYPA